MHHPIIYVLKCHFSNNIFTKLNKFVENIYQLNILVDRRTFCDANKISYKMFNANFDSTTMAPMPLAVNLMRKIN